MKEYTLIVHLPNGDMVEAPFDTAEPELGSVFVLGLYRLVVMYVCGEDVYTEHDDTGDGWFGKG